MIGPNKRGVMLLCIAFMWWPSMNMNAATPAPTPAAPAAEIQQIKKQIAQITQSIRRNEQQYKQENATLFNYDAHIANNLTELKQLHRQQAQLQAEIESARMIKKTLATEIVDSQKTYSELARLFFLSKDNSHYLKALFSASEPGESGKWGRSPIYFSYIQKVYQVSLSGLNERLSAQNTNNQMLQGKLSALEILLTENRTKLAELTSKREDRQQYLFELDKKITASKGNKQRLQSDQARLEKLAKELEALAIKAKKAASGMGFAKRNNGLMWPVEGKITGQYGKSRISSGIKWRGLLIAANAGEPVKAVSAGQVIFADWLSGYGYVIILDHGKDYLSLYGHNQQVFAQLGQIVDSGEQIAEVGNSGRSGDPALYFEIRYKGKPVNPHEWLLAKK